jgi:hypothetical protein
MIVSYTDSTSSPVPLRSTAHGRNYPAAPGSTPTVHYDSDGRVRYSDQSFVALVEDAVKRQKAADLAEDHSPGWVAPRDPRLGPGDRDGLGAAIERYDGNIFDRPPAPASETELAYREQVRRVEEVRRQRPGLSVSEALAEVTRYGAGEPQVKEEPPAAAPTPAPVALQSGQYASDLRWLVERYGPAHPPRERYASTAAGDEFRKANTGFITLPTPPELLQDKTWRNAKAPSADVGAGRLPSQTSRPGGGSLSASIGRVLAKGRQVAGQLEAAGGNGRQGDRVMRGLAAAVAQRKAAGSPSMPGGDGKPPGGAGVTIPVPNKPPGGGGPARAAAAVPTPAPAPASAPDPRAGWPSQMRADRTSDHSFLDPDPGPPKAPASPVSTGRTATLIPKAPDPSRLPSQARADKTSDVGAPRPMPALTSDPAPTMGDLPETRPAGILSPGQSSKGQMARQNTVSAPARAAKMTAEAVMPKQDSIGGRESRSGLQSQPGSAGLKPITDPRPPVSASPRPTRSERDRAATGISSIV